MNIIKTKLEFGKLEYRNTCTALILHHAAHNSCSVYDIHRWHKLDNGWSGIGYHFFITKDGQVYRGRPEKSVGAHCLKHNKYSLGICVQGNYMKEIMPQKQIKAVIELCTNLCCKYNISIIKGHKELNNTNCPGINFPLDEIRKQILNDRNNIDTYTVKLEDTLWSISKKFNMSIDELKKLNNLKTDIIYTNQILKIL